MEKRPLHTAAVVLFCCLSHVPEASSQRFLSSGGNLSSPRTFLQQIEQPRQPTVDEKTEEERLIEQLEAIPPSDREGRAAAETRLEVFREQVRERVPPEGEIAQSLTFGPGFESTRDDISIGFTVGYTNREWDRHPAEVALEYAWVNEKGSARDFSASGLEASSGFGKARRAPMSRPSPRLAPSRMKRTATGNSRAVSPLGSRFPTS